MKAMDRSNGYEGVAADFLAGRAGPQSPGIGAATVRERARQLTPGATVLDLGCGSGVPITSVLVEAGLAVYALDSAPSLVAAFKRRFPDTPVVCEAAKTRRFLSPVRSDSELGVMFLSSPPAQHALIRRIGGALNFGGRLLFTSPGEAVSWNDAMTGRESRSLGAVEYRRLLSAAGLAVVTRATTRAKTITTRPSRYPSPRFQPHRRGWSPRE